MVARDFDSRVDETHSRILSARRARNLDEYVELAVSFAADLPRLSALRAGLRERMAVSPLCDGNRFAENLMRVLRDIWRQWCHNTGG